MPQFAYRATDRLGNVVDGSLMASDHAQAILQLQALSLTPIGVQLAGAVPAAVPQASQPATPVAANRPRDLTQPVTEMPVAAVDLFAQQHVPEPTIELTAVLATADVGLAAGVSSATAIASTGAEDTRARMGVIEPWERSVPAEGAAPAGLDTTVAMSPSSQPARYRASTVRGLENIPFGANSSREVPLHQRAKEVLIYPIISGVRLKELAQWYRQFGTLVNAGLNMHQSLTALADNTKNQMLKSYTNDCARQVRAGGYVSDVMAAYPWIFPPMHLEMVRAAEVGGMMEDTLNNLGNYVEQELEVKRLIKRETLYPKIVMVVMVMLMGRTGIFGGMPAIAAWFLGGATGQYVANTLGFALAILVPMLAAYILFRLFAFNSPGFRNMYDTVKINLPVVGKIIRNFAVSKFARTYASLSAAGFPSSSALQIAGDASGNVVIARASQYAMRLAEQGCNPSRALADTGQFDSMTIDMLQTAEMSGSVDDMMSRVADYHEAEAKASTHTVAMIFSVCVLLIVGVLVGFVAIQAYGGNAQALNAAGAPE